MGQGGKEYEMKKFMLFILVALWPAVAAADVGVNVNIGVTPPVVVAPAPGPPQVVLSVAPRFIFSPTLGFYVSVGVPYDIVFMDSNYYLYASGAWYSAQYYNGPWARARHVPAEIRRYRHEDIRHYRDTEYRAYERDREHYNGRWYQPERGLREEHHVNYEDHHGGHEGHHEH